MKSVLSFSFLNSVMQFTITLPIHDRQPVVTSSTFLELHPHEQSGRRVVDTTLSHFVFIQTTSTTPTMITSGQLQKGRACKCKLIYDSGTRAETDHPALRVQIYETINYYWLVPYTLHSVCRKGTTPSYSQINDRFRHLTPCGLPLA